MWELAFSVLMSGLVGSGAVHIVLSGRPFGGQTPPIPYICFIMDICRYKSDVLVQIGCALQQAFRKIELEGVGCGHDELEVLGGARVG